MVPAGSCCARHIRIYEPLALSRAQPVRMIPQNHAVAVALVTRPTSSYDPPKSRRGRRCKRTFVSSFIPIYYNQVNQVPRGLSFSFTRSVLRGKALSFIFTHPPVDKTKQGKTKKSKFGLIIDRLTTRAPPLYHTPGTQYCTAVSWEKRGRGRSSTIRDHAACARAVYTTPCNAMQFEVRTPTIASRSSNRCCCCFMPLNPSFQ